MSHIWWSWNGWRSLFLVEILTLRWSPPDFNCEAEAGVGGLHPGVRCMIRRVIAWTASPLFSHKLLPFLSLELFYAGVFRFFGWKHQNRSEIISEVTCRQRKQATVLCYSFRLYTENAPIPQKNRLNNCVPVQKAPPLYTPYRYQLPVWSISPVTAFHCQGNPCFSFIE